MSLRLRLVLTLAPLFVIGLVVADVVTYSVLHGQLFSQLDNELFDIHDNVGDAVLAVATGQNFPPNVRSLPPGTYGAILTPDNHTVATFDVSLNGGPNDTSHPDLPASAPTMFHQYFDAAGTGTFSSYRVYVDDIPNSADVLVAAVPADKANATLGQVLLLEVLITAGLTLVVGGATWFIVRTSLKPLERMAAMARSIAATDLSRRVEPSTENTEVGQLGLALNTMLSQLETAFTERERNEQRLRHFISDASHELRTPL
ncbi:MAG: HAMP domain-containing protein, partial [Candidatus Dormibacteraeota bacterium]|nr:HAMP domain-containing protein [Candidatus Dormibacteraeota bacterium]